MWFENAKPGTAKTADHVEVHTSVSLRANAGRASFQQSPGATAEVNFDMPLVGEREILATRYGLDPLAVLLLGDGDRIVGASGDVIDLTGFSQEELLGRELVPVLRRAGIDLKAAPTAPLRENQQGVYLWEESASSELPVRAVLVVRLPSSDAFEKALVVDRLVLDQLPGVIWTTDAQLQITSVLGQVERNLGVSAEQLVGMHVGELARSNEPTDPAIVLHHAALRGERSSITYHLRDRWHEICVEPLRGPAGSIVGTVGTAIDVTRRISAEHRATARAADLVESLKTSVSLLQATIESTADGLLVVDRGGRISVFNQRFKTMWCIPRAIADRRDDRELLAFVSEQLVEGHQFLEGVRAVYDKPDVESLDVLHFKDGRIFERYSRPQRTNGTIVGRVWSFRDVTVRERALSHARFLAEASRLLGALDLIPALQTIAQLAVMVMVDGCAFDLLRARETHRVVSISRHPSITVPEVIPSAVIAGGRATCRRAGRAQVAYPLVETRTGATVGALTVTGKSSVFPPYEVDVFEELARRCTNALDNAAVHRHHEEEIRAREEFLAVASHEFRGPLTGLGLALAGVRDGIAPQARFVDAAERELRRMTKLVEDLLDVSRMRSGPPEFDLTSVDLVDAVTAVVARFDRELARTPSRVAVEADVGVVGTWDQGRIEQVAEILLSNAIKFGAGGPIEVSVRRRGDRAILQVTDHGIGIPQEFLPSIFDPFARAAPARKYGGLGLGLYIAQQIVLGLHGEISAQSPPSGGAVITVELPMESKR